MLKIIAIIIGTVIYSGHQISPAIALSEDRFSAEKEILLVDNQLLASNDPRDSEELTKILILVGLVSVVGTIGWQVSRQRPASRSLPKLGKIKNKALIDRVSPKLRRQLLRLINDPKTANRLLMGIYQHNRDRDPDWLAEKAIYDLRRGR